MMRRQGGFAIAVPTSPIQIMYAENMRGVDTYDQYRAGFSTQIFTKKWWHRIYFFGFDSALTNSYIIHKHLCMSKDQRYMEHGKYQLAVAQALMGRPLPKDFGMPMSTSTSATTSSSVRKRRSRGSRNSEPLLPKEEAIHPEEPMEVVLSQESINNIVQDCEVPHERIGIPQEVGQDDDVIVQVAEAPIVLQPPVDNNLVNAQRRRRPNKPPPRIRPAPVHLNVQKHYLKKVKLRRVCREYRRRTKWICPGCERLSMCLENCFVHFHRLLGM
jgi:hypothetical protein